MQPQVLLNVKRQDKKQQQLTQLLEAPADTDGSDADAEVVAVHACGYTEGDQHVLPSL